MVVVALVAAAGLRVVAVVDEAVAVEAGIMTGHEGEMKVLSVR